MKQYFSVNVHKIRAVKLNNCYHCIVHHLQRNNVTLKYIVASTHWLALSYDYDQTL